MQRGIQNWGVLGHLVTRWDPKRKKGSGWEGDEKETEPLEASPIAFGGPPWEKGQEIHQGGLEEGGKGCYLTEANPRWSRGPSFCRPKGEEKRGKYPHIQITKTGLPDNPEQRAGAQWGNHKRTVSVNNNRRNFGKSLTTNDARNRAQKNWGSGSGKTVGEQMD